jgi:transcriptional regulator with GAF, ATPase, and Fis domain
VTEESKALASAARDALTGAVFTGLAELVYAGDKYDTVFAALCNAAPRLVHGCDHASLMVRRDGSFETAASSDDVAKQIDALEREVGDGPCVDAIVDEAYQLDADLETKSQWPLLAERVREETPVRGMAGFRMMVGGAKVGALNIFSDTRGALTVVSADQAAVLAAFASVALAAVEQREQATTLREGLQSNREIGKAVGLLMTAHKVNDDEAFGILRRASQDLNMKLAEVAREFVTHHNNRR